MPAVAYPSPNRQKALFHYSLTSLLLLWPLIAQAKINVVATLPDLGSLAREIRKDKVDIVVINKLAPAGFSRRRSWLTASFTSAARTDFSTPWNKRAVSLVTSDFEINVENPKERTF